jgi:signal transduction histidine kinase
MSGVAVDERLRDELGQAVSAGENLRATLEDILHVRQSESGMLEPKLERLDADAVLADAIAAVVGTARARQVQIAWVACAGNSHVEVDRKLVKRAFENLLSNAIKYSPSGAEVWANIFEVAGGISVEIADRGAGVPEAFKAELFKKFGSVEAARGDVRRGFGLGLHLVSLVASAHGGRAFVRDREGGGTIFGLFLPRRPSRRQGLA